MRRYAALVAAALIALTFAVPVSASNDGFWSELWGMHRIGAERAWQGARGDGVTIAIVDTGVDLLHEDLRGALVPGYDFVEDDAVPQDANGHGTHVAGTAAARANNRLGVAGVAPGAKIMPVRVLGADGSGSSADLEAGVRWAVEHGADVVNLSLGDRYKVNNLTGEKYRGLVDYAWSKGVIPVLAAANDRLFRTELADARALIVTATTRDDTKASYANSVGFARWGLAAPGGTSSPTNAAILSTWWRKGATNRYAWLTGTSMAAPHVSGAAALLLGRGLSPQQTVDHLLATAKDLGERGDDFTYGHGRLDVAAATARWRTAASERRSTPQPQAGSRPDTNRAPPVAEQPDEVPDRSATPSPKPKRTPKDASPTPDPDASPDVGPIAVSEEPPNSVLPYALGAGALLAAGGGLLAYTAIRRRRAV